MVGSAAAFGDDATVWGSRRVYPVRAWRRSSNAAARMTVRRGVPCEVRISSESSRRLLVMPLREKSIAWRLCEAIALSLALCLASTAVANPVVSEKVQALAIPCTQDVKLILA